MKNRNILRSGGRLVRNSVRGLRRACGAKPRVLILIDTWNWAFHIIAAAAQRHLSGRFAITILSVSEKPQIDESCYDIIHVLFETETYHHQFLRGRAKILKSVYSHYWQLEGLSAEQFYNQSLAEADALTVPSKRLHALLLDVPVPVHLFEEGVDTDLFQQQENVQREHAVGWAGKDIPIKRLDWIRAACNGLYELKTANGTHRYEDMPAFFSSIRIIACASIAEGCPRPVLEGMACGAFPISFDVGIVPEVVQTGINGLIVEEQSPQGLRDALQWCTHNPDILERARAYNRDLVSSTRSWSKTTQQLAAAYDAILG